MMTILMVKEIVNQVSLGEMIKVALLVAMQVLVEQRLAVQQLGQQRLEQLLFIALLNQ
ncbi:hypothetical protein [Lentilactobacillus curieae]|uniref:hypothetical protein n=1 Tax=Lentilactobacillus curieae TaxID=1138822 RepID=UPI0017859900|nr:hypothetical protein [Lentilactobacillus curieae]